MPQGGLDALKTQDPLDILAWQYDIVCNGTELSSGAVRNHSHGSQVGSVNRISPVSACRQRTGYRIDGHHDGRHGVAGSCLNGLPRFGIISNRAIWLVSKRGQRMSILNSVVAGVVALLGVLLGGFITIRNQEKMWMREHDRQWRDIRLRTFEDFVAACRAMMAYITSTSAEITATPHPRRAGERIPHFTESGLPVREEMESTISKLRLVALMDETTIYAHRMVYALRDLAAARALYPHDEIPDNMFVQFFVAQQCFLTAARAEMGLPELPDRGRETEGARTTR